LKTRGEVENKVESGTQVSKTPPLWRLRLNRLAVGATNVGLAVLAILGSAFTIYVGQLCPQPYVVIGLLVFVAIALVLWLAQSVFEYKRRTSDPTWIVRFQETWDGPQAMADRKRAATLLKNCGGKVVEPDKYFDDLAGIDEALDRLEDIGYYVSQEQISPEAAHNHLFYWIRGYWHASCEYIKESRNKPGERSRWENLEKLFYLTAAVESERSKCSMDEALKMPDDINKFLQGEIEP
jgi:hypothetical protein